MNLETSNTLEACGVVNTVMSLRELGHLRGCQICTLSPLSSRGGDNYVSYPAEDTGSSCTPITLICSCLWEEEVSRRGEIKEQREVALDAYQRVKMAGANFWLFCKCLSVCISKCSWHFSRPLCPWLMTNPRQGVDNSFAAPAYSSKILHLKDEGD